MRRLSWNHHRRTKLSSKIPSRLPRILLLDGWPVAKAEVLVVARRWKDARARLNPLSQGSGSEDIAEGK